MLTPGARARLGGSYDRQGCEGRGHNSNVYFDEDLEPGQCPERAEQAEPAPFARRPERCKRQPKRRRERQLGCLEQVGRNGHGGPRHNARGQEPPRLAQGRHDQGCQPPGDYQGVEEAQGGGDPEHGQDVFDEAVRPERENDLRPPLEVVLEAECQALLPGAEAGEDRAPWIGPPAEQRRQGAHQCNCQPAEGPAWRASEALGRWLRGGYFEVRPAIGLLLRRGSWERHLQTLAAQVSGTTRCCGSVKR